MSLPHAAAELLTRLKDEAPAVHCITNEVAINFTANILLAAGARPSMTTDPGEVSDFVRSADAVLINLGTLDDKRREAIGLALDVAGEAQLPWVLDPVFVDRSPARSAFAVELLGRGPAAVRANAREMRALGNEKLSNLPVVVIETGVTDRIVADGRTFAISNGDPLFAQVAATGCALSALVAAAIAVGREDRASAVAGAVLAFDVAGELAAERAEGPGSFALHLIDALAALDAVALTQRGRIS